jgi:hypothetical protein
MNVNASPLSNRSGWTRRLIVTLAIGSAAAAVTANVALSEPPSIQREWRDTWLHATPPDPSLPTADKALAGGGDGPAEGAPTF